MMWWVNKFGRVTGPYSDEQIQSGIRQNQFTRLNKISNDQQTWMRLDQTKFWQPVSSAPESVAAANPFETGAAPGKLRRPSATPTPGPTPFRRPAPEPEPEPVPPPRQTPPLSSRFDLNQKPAGGDGGGKNRKWLWIGGGIAACFAAALVAVVLVIGVLAYLGSQAEDDGVETADGSSGEESPSQFEEVKKRVVLVHGNDGSSGTGFLVKMDGKKYVVSNDHVVRSSSMPEMVLVDGTKLKLGAFSEASDRDLARFELLDYDGDCLEFSNEVPNVGDKVWVYGNSMGDDVITALKGSVTGVGGKFIKTDTEAVSGNSGSPILNREGKVIAVHSFSKRGEEGRRWNIKGTQFDNVRRFGVRAANVDWVQIDRREYEKECLKLEDISTYFGYLLNYLRCDTVSEDEAKNLILEHKDVYRKSFHGLDGQGFHEMLKSVSRSYEKWKASERRLSQYPARDAVCKRLDDDVQAEKLTLEDAKKELADYDRSCLEAWETLKSKRRDFIAKRKEALLMMRGVLTQTEWQCPLIKHGRSQDDDESVDWHLGAVQHFLDLNAQKMKDFNKTLRKWEGKEDEE